MRSVNFKTARTAEKYIEYEMCFIFLIKVTCNGSAISVEVSSISSAVVESLLVCGQTDYRLRELNRRSVGS